MESQDVDLLKRHTDQDEELNALWEEHQLYEQQLEKLEKKPYLTPGDLKAVKEIKKKKLNGKTKIQFILDRYRTTEE
jgi:uncharacterized protein